MFKLVWHYVKKNFPLLVGQKTFEWTEIYNLFFRFFSPIHCQNSKINQKSKVTSFWNTLHPLAELCSNKCIKMRYFEPWMCVRYPIRLGFNTWICQVMPSTWLFLNIGALKWGQIMRQPSNLIRNQKIIK